MLVDSAPDPAETPVEGGLFAAPIDGAVVRLLHAAFLLRGGEAMAREFWSGHPLDTPDGSVLTGASLHERVWSEASRYPCDWIVRVLDSIESFCLRHGIGHLEWIRQTLVEVHDGCLLSSKSCLRMVGRHLGEFLGGEDLHDTLLRLLHSETRGSGIELRLVRRDDSSEKRGAWIQARFTGSCGEIKSSAVASWLAMVLEVLPRRFGGASFDSVRILADTRSMIDALTWSGRLPDVRKSGGKWIGPKGILSESVETAQWARGIGLPEIVEDCEASGNADQVLQDWRCSQRKRKILSTGSLLGAPWCLFRVEWTREPSALAASLGHLIREVTEDRLNESWMRAEALHEKMIAADRHRLEFVYHLGDETISCNGNHLLRGVPAKILQKVLIAHTVTGRTLFEHREFRRDPDLNLDPANPNLESRLRLLSQRLEDRLPGFRLCKAGRGKFQIETDVGLAYMEDVPIT
ncbi:MAG: hypothetical protein H6686_05500 [Fibrobacteria bacterium]|nr:hypothetical protein [Fibrobacteria bacterium]